jgi:hypothetical protein
MDSPGSPEVRLADKYLADTRAELAAVPDDGPELREFLDRLDGTLFGSQPGLLEPYLAHARMTGAILDVYLTLRAGDMLVRGLPRAETLTLRKERVKFRQAVAGCLLPAEGRVPERGPGDADAGPVPTPPWLARSMVCVMTDGGPGPSDGVDDGSAGSGAAGSGGGAASGDAWGHACRPRKTAALTNGCPDPGFTPGSGRWPSRSCGR